MLSRMRAPRSDAIRVLVADEIPEASRNALARAGWGYLDRRGHLRVMDTTSMLLIDVEVDPLVRSTPRPREPIRGASGISYAAALLMEPDEPPSIRGIARRARLSVSTVAEAARSIRDAALIGRDGRPLIPDLFWALSDAWRPERIPLLGKPKPGEESTTAALRVFGDPAEPGWAVTGDVAAVSYDAPLAVGAGSPPDFYVPGRLTATNAARTYGIAPDPSVASCTVAVAPTLLACAPRFEASGRKGGVVEFLLVHPVFVALDLASDKARGAEIAVTLVGNEARRLIVALDRLASSDVPFTLVGGLAVLTRLARPYRVTTDLDAVTLGPERVPWPPALSLLRRRSWR